MDIPTAAEDAPNADNSLLIASLNVRGLLPKLDDIALIIAKFNLSVFGICETFLDNDINVQEFTIPGFKTVFKHRTRHGGGVLMYIKDDVNFDELHVDGDTESVWIKMTNGKTPVVVGMMYRPPSACRDYYVTMLNQLDIVHANDCHVILMGDLNFDVNSGTNNCPVKNIESLYDMSQLVNKPTRVTLTSSTLIDVMLSNRAHLHKITDVYECSLSDHYMVYTGIVFEREANVNHNNVQFRNFRHFDPVSFINDLSNCVDIYDCNWSDDLFQSNGITLSQLLYE